MMAPAEGNNEYRVNYRLLRIALERFGASPDSLPEGQLHEAKRIARNEEELEQLVLNSPEARYVSVPDSQLETALRQIRQRFEDDAGFSDALAANGFDEQEIRAGIRQELKVESVMDLVASRAHRVDEEEAARFYSAHPESFTVPETRTARHILITINPDYAENDRESARQRLQAIADRLTAAPERFRELAMQNSECPSGLNGGLLGELKQGMLYPELDKELFAMDEGEVRGPLETEMGWHLLLCEKICQQQLMPLHQVMPKLVEELQQRQNRRFQKQWLRQQAGLRGK